MPAANSYLLADLLGRGHLVDLFQNPAYVYPRELLARPGFTYVECSSPLPDRLHFTGKNAGSDAVARLAALVDYRLFGREVVKKIARRHSGRPYDLVLFLGTWAFARVVGLPSVSWVQGPPGTDARSVIQHRDELRRTTRALEYWKLRAFAAYRLRVGLPPFGATDKVVVGSTWSAETLSAQYDVPQARVASLPYPIDLAHFDPKRSPAGLADPIVLGWLGRIVPRKRLDLFLDAGARLIDAGLDVRLDVVGAFPFAKEARGRIEAFPHPDRLSYRPALDRDGIPAWLRDLTVLVQPSENEDFGSSVAEALACGTPAVVGRSNGMRDYVGGAGEVFSVYSSDSVARAIRRLVNRMSSEDMTTVARGQAEETFSVDQVGSRFEDLLMNVAAGRG